MANLPKVAEMFGDQDSPREIAERFEHYKSELNKSLSAPRPLPNGPGSAELNEVESLEKALGSNVISKALAPELVDSVRNALAESQIGKEWTAGTGSNGNPVPGGLAAFDLEAPFK
jgi:hypothetical protein